MKILITADEVILAIADYCETQGIMIDPELIKVTPQGTVEIEASLMRTPPISVNNNVEPTPIQEPVMGNQEPTPGQSSTDIKLDPFAPKSTVFAGEPEPTPEPEFETKGFASDAAKKVDPFAPPVTEPAAQTDPGIWNRDNWVNLRSTGFRPFVEENLATLVDQDDEIQKAVTAKWATIYKDEPFPAMPSEAPVNDLEEEEAAIDNGSKTVQEVITDSTGGDITDKEAPSLEAEGTPPKKDSLFG